MIIGIGCDIVEHEVTMKLNWGLDTSIQNRIFTSEELEIYSNKKDIKVLAGKFAAKEAVLKCLGTGMQDGIALTDIQILNTENDKPTIVLQGGAKTISDIMEINLWHVSITHSYKYSMAFIVAEKT